MNTFKVGDRVHRVFVDRDLMTIVESLTVKSIDAAGVIMCRHKILHDGKMIASVIDCRADQLFHSRAKCRAQALADLKRQIELRITRMMEIASDVKH